MSNYETIQLSATDTDELRLNTQQMVMYFETNGKEVVSHSIYWDNKRNHYMISMIGRNKS